MPTTQPLCRLDDIQDGGARLVNPDLPWPVVVLRRGDAVYAYYNVCGHLGRNLDYLPGKFLIDKGCIVCAAHGATFDIETGTCRSGPATSGLKPIPVRVADGAVWLDM